jgi:hypothetical protein
VGLLAKMKTIENCRIKPVELLVQPVFLAV